ncbi:MAG: universal stress protein [Promethearchaeota archaeon]|jgi:nucleotide-binding universal stress UspA family protein
MYKKILLATDGSNHIDQAASIIIGFYKKWSSKIVIFHSIKHMLEKVTPPSHGINTPYTSEAYFTSTPSSKPVLVMDEQDPNITRLSEQEITRIGEAILEEKKAIFNELQIPVKTRLVLNDYPEEYILRKAKEKNYDLIVVGIKGVHSTLSQILVGSVADHALKNATCDVLVIK